MAHTPPPLPATFTDQTGYRWSLLASLDSLPAACAPMLLALFRPSAQEAGATIVLSAGKTATPLASAAAVLARFGRGRLERDLASHRSEEHTSELQSLAYLVCRLLLEKKKPNTLV